MGIVIIYEVGDWKGRQDETQDEEWRNNGYRKTAEDIDTEERETNDRIRNGWLDG